MCAAIKWIFTEGFNVKATQFFCNVQHTKSLVIWDDIAESNPYILFREKHGLADTVLSQAEKNNQVQFTFTRTDGL